MIKRNLVESVFEDAISVAVERVYFYDRLTVLHCKLPSFDLNPLEDMSVITVEYIDDWGVCLRNEAHFGSWINLHVGVGRQNGAFQINDFDAMIQWKDEFV